MKTVENLKELMVDELRDIYNSETQLVKALPKLAKAASSPDLKEAFENHFEETKGHVNRLEKIFSKLKEDPKGKKCEATEGLVQEGQDAIDETDKESEIRNAALIASGRKVEHYEIANYGNVIGFAEALGEREIARLLEETLTEEEAAEEKLTELSKAALEKIEG